MPQLGSWKAQRYFKMVVFVAVFRQGLTVRPWLAWNSEMHLPLPQEWWDQSCAPLGVATAPISVKNFQSSKLSHLGWYNVFCQPCWATSSSTEFNPDSDCMLARYCLSWRKQVWPESKWHPLCCGLGCESGGNQGVWVSLGHTVNLRSHWDAWDWLRTKMTSI